jgi:hypothetical protein
MTDYQNIGYHFRRTLMKLELMRRLQADAWGEQQHVYERNPVRYASCTLHALCLLHFACAMPSALCMRYALCTLHARNVFPCGRHCDLQNERNPEVSNVCFERVILIQSHSAVSQFPFILQVAAGCHDVAKMNKYTASCLPCSPSVTVYTQFWTPVPCEKGHTWPKTN